jgi:hypothetical protein
MISWAFVLGSLVGGYPDAATVVVPGTKRIANLSEALERARVWATKSTSRTYRALCRTHGPAGEQRHQAKYPLAKEVRQT